MGRWWQRGGTERGREGGEKTAEKGNLLATYVREFRAILSSGERRGYMRQRWPGLDKTYDTVQNDYKKRALRVRGEAGYFRCRTPPRPANRVCVRQGRARYTADREPCEHKTRPKSGQNLDHRVGVSSVQIVCSGKTIPNRRAQHGPCSSECLHARQNKRGKRSAGACCRNSLYIPGRNPRSSNHPRAERGLGKRRRRWRQALRWTTGRTGQADSGKRSAHEDAWSDVTLETVEARRPAGEIGLVA